MDDVDVPTLINPLALRAKGCLLAGTACLCLGGLILYLDIRWVSEITPPPTLGLFGFMLGALLITGGVILLPMAGVFMMQSGRVDTDLTAYRYGNTFAHWVHEPQDWLVIVHNRRIRRYRAAIVWFLVLLGIGALVGCILLLTLSGMDAILGFIGAVLLGEILGFLTAFWIRVWARNSTDSMLCSGGHVFINGTSAHCGDEHLFWRTSCRSLQSAEIVEGNPRRMVLAVEFSMGAWGPLLQVALTASGRYQRVPQSSKMVMSIPIPRGCEAEADGVIARLLSEAKRFE